MSRKTVTRTKDGLTQAQQLFVDTYMLGNSAEKSAIAAGYSAASARTTGPRLLQNPAVARVVAARQAKHAKKQENIEARLLREMEALAFANIEDLITVDADGLPQVDFSRATREQLSAVTSIATKRRSILDPKGKVVGVETNAKFTLADKRSALELLMRHRGMLKPEEHKVTIDVADRLLRARTRLHGNGEAKQLGSAGSGSTLIGDVVASALPEDEDQGVGGAGV